MPQHEPLDAPERRCILTGQHGERDSLIRLALGPDGTVMPDLGARAPGRGAWIGVGRADLETAAAKGRLRPALARAFKANATAPDNLGALIEAGLKRRTLDRLGLEMRAGHLILGNDRIGDAIKSGQVYLLLHAADAGADGCAKLDGKLKGAGSRTSLTLPADRTELSMALGRENVVHAALSDDAAAKRVASAAERWRAFCGISDQVTGADLLSAPGE